MAIVLQVVTPDEPLLTELHTGLTSGGLTVSAPSPVEDAASLDLDLAGIDPLTLWNFIVAVGQLAGALQVVQSIVDLVSRHRKEDAETRVEVAIGGAKVTFSGDMSSREMAKRVDDFRILAKDALG